MVIELTYTTEDGKEHSETYPSDIEEIDLSNRRISEIDLTSLSTCLNLKALVLKHNLLQGIDFTPLSSCTKLKGIILFGNKITYLDFSPIKSCIEVLVLDLMSNKLRYVDLSPLESCIKLEVLILNDNLLQSIDLSPLRTCNQLRCLDLEENNLRDIDLEPLETCQSLTELLLEFNPLNNIDLTPIAHHSQLEKLSFEQRTELQLHFSLLKDIAELSLPVRREINRIKVITSTSREQGMKEDSPKYQRSTLQDSIFFLKSLKLRHKVMLVLIGILLMVLPNFISLLTGYSIPDSMQVIEYFVMVCGLLVSLAGIFAILSSDAAKTGIDEKRHGSKI